MSMAFPSSVTMNGFTKKSYLKSNLRHILSVRNKDVTIFFLKKKKSPSHKIKHFQPFAVSQQYQIW